MLLALLMLAAAAAFHHVKHALYAMVAFATIASVYMYMYTEACTFVHDPSVYYSVNHWAENLSLLVILLEGMGIGCWVKVLYGTFTGKK